ncbi:MAG TPA: hypothetical protein VE078_00395 [Thermoanaerobaculia bacterium]|nr:hypothetical protein [Thermoanaerobaculia bacterium]
MKSDYQVFKLWWVSVLPLTKDAIHVYIGFLCLLLALIVFRRRLSSFTALIPGIIVSIAMEILDLRDGFGWLASLKDLVNTNLIPFLLVLLTRWRTYNV